MTPLQDPLDCIARYLSSKEISPLATTSKEYDAWRKDRVAKDSESLTLYIQNVLKNSKTDKEISDHFRSFVRQYTTPFKLTLTHSEVTDAKLRTIADKFPNPNQLIYTRPDKLLPETPLRKVAWKVAYVPFVCTAYILFAPFILREKITKQRFMYDQMPDFMKKTFGSIGESYNATRQTLARDMRLEKVASLFRTLSKLEIHLSPSPSPEKETGESLFSLPHFDKLQQLVIKQLPSSLNHSRDISPNERIFAHLEKVTHLHIDAYISHSIEGIRYPAKLQKFYKRTLLKRDIKDLLTHCPELQSLSCRESESLNNGPITLPCESLKKFKILDSHINTHNLFLSFPKISHLCYGCPSVTDLAASPCLEKLTLYTIGAHPVQALDSLPAKYPNLKSVKIVSPNNTVIPPEFEEVSRGITSNGKPYIRLKPNY